MKQTVLASLALVTLAACCGGGSGSSAAANIGAVPIPTGASASVSFVASQAFPTPPNSAAATAPCPSGALLLETASGSLVGASMSEPTQYTDAIFIVSGCNASATDSVTVTSSNAASVNVAGSAPLLGFSVDSTGTAGTSTVTVKDTTTGAVATFAVSV